MSTEAVTEQLVALMESGRFSTEDLYSIQPAVVLTLALEAGPENWSEADHEDVAEALMQIGLTDADVPAEQINRALARYLESGTINADLLREVFQILLNAFGDSSSAIDLRSHAEGIGVDTRQSAPPVEETQKAKTASIGSLAQLKTGSFRI